MTNDKESLMHNSILLGRQFKEYLNSSQLMFVILKENIILLHVNVTRKVYFNRISSTMTITIKPVYIYEKKDFLKFKFISDSFTNYSNLLDKEGWQFRSTKENIHTYIKKSFKIRSMKHSYNIFS